MWSYQCGSYPIIQSFATANHPLLCSMLSCIIAYRRSTKGPRTSVMRMLRIDRENGIKHKILKTFAAAIFACCQRFGRSLAFRSRAVIFSFAITNAHKTTFIVEIYMLQFTRWRRVIDSDCRRRWRYRTGLGYACNAWTRTHNSCACTTRSTYTTRTSIYAHK